MSEYFIRRALKHKGALHRELGYKRGSRIPKTLLRRIENKRVGQKFILHGKKIKVTTKLKRRVNFALTLESFPRR